MRREGGGKGRGGKGKGGRREKEEGENGKVGE